MRVAHVKVVRILVKDTTMSRVIPGTPKDMGPLMVSGAHTITIPISLGILMGIVWIRGPIIGGP